MNRLYREIACGLLFVIAVAIIAGAGPVYWAANPELSAMQVLIDNWLAFALALSILVTKETMEYFSSRRDP